MGPWNAEGLAVVLHTAALPSGMRRGETSGWRSSGTPCAESVIRWRYGALLAHRDDGERRISRYSMLCRVGVGTREGVCFAPRAELRRLPEGRSHRSSPMPTCSLATVHIALPSFAEVLTSVLIADLEM